MHFHARDLRKGRYSHAGYIYLITTVTHKRQNFFLNFQYARILINTLKNADLNQYSSTIGFVVMPDHLHWLMSLGKIKDLSSTVKYIKGTSTYQINRYDKNADFVWQAGFHDHALRTLDDATPIMRYVIANPLRRGLVRTVRKYPHWDCVYL
jgi:REP element-mobilizing transposase RayT